MLKKVLVRNVGVLKAFDTPGAPQFEQLTSFYARNGRGKTTLSAILRSAGKNDPDFILGRRTFGQACLTAEVTLIFENNNAIKFKSGKWQKPATWIDVFDVDFVANNIHAGESTDLAHDRNLFRIVLGDAGVKLAKQQEFFVSVAKKTSQRLKEAEAALANDLPNEMGREEFFALAEDPYIDQKILVAEKDLRATQQTERVSKLGQFKPLDFSYTNFDPRAILGRTIPDIEASVRDKLADHFKRFDLAKQGEAWVKYGVEHVKDDTCPFCARPGVNDNGQVDIYNKIFGEAYRFHFNEIKFVAGQLDEYIGPEARTALAAEITRNAQTSLDWSEFVEFSDLHLPSLESALFKIQNAYKEFKSLFDVKRQSPLTAIGESSNSEALLLDLSEALRSIGIYNSVIHKLGILVEAKRSGIRSDQLKAQALLYNLEKQKRRFDTGVETRIATALRAKRRDVCAKAARSTIQSRLKAKSEEGASHFHKQVNYYLDKFGAKFQISKISNSMSSNTGSVDYGLVIRGHRIDRGRGRSNRVEATFMNTLSTGDKTTLAFAFFLAQIDRQEPDDLRGRIIVFDDPLSSHDTHRHAVTIDLIFGLCSRCAQVIVLSHDAHFLRGVNRRCLGSKRAVYEIEYDGPEAWSIAKPADLNHLCENEQASRIKKLQRYYEFRHGSLAEVAQAIRTVLETYFRAAYQGYFSPDITLGNIVLAIQKGGASHPCWSKYAALDFCNVNTRSNHHGDSPVINSAPIEPDELHVLVKTCLLLVHVIPA